MPAKVVCPSCHMSLNAPDDLLGQTVKCEECGSTFTARAPARPRSESAGPDRGAKPRYRRRDRESPTRNPTPAARTRAINGERAMKSRALLRRMSPTIEFTLVIA